MSNTNTHSDTFPLIHAKKSSDGLSKPLACNDNGELLTASSSSGTQNVKLEDLTSSLDADHINHTRSIAVGLRGFTDPANHHSSGQFIKASSDGRLECMILGAGDILGNTPRHLTIDANGRTLTNPLMTTTNTHLTNIKTNTNIVRDVENITTNFAGSNLNLQIDSGGFTASVDLQNHRHIHFLVRSAETTRELIVQGSHDNTTFTDVIGVFPTSIDGGVNYRYNHKIINGAYRYYRLYNKDVSFISFSNIQITKLNL